MVLWFDGMSTKMVLYKHKIIGIFAPLDTSPRAAMQNATQRDSSSGVYAAG